MVGWRVHFMVLGVLAALGAWLSYADYYEPGGAELPLRGAASTGYWMFFAAYLAITSAAFYFARRRPAWVVVAYVVAMPVAFDAAMVAAGGDPFEWVYWLRGLF